MTEPLTNYNKDQVKTPKAEGVINATDPPQFPEPDYSYKFEELTQEQRDNFYKRKYKTTMTKKEILKVSGLGFLSLCTLIFIGGMLVRLLVTLAVWGYTLFGVL